LASTVDHGWKRPFDDPIAAHRGGQLVTLEDAATAIDTGSRRLRRYPMNRGRTEN
jgi:hypothetical protein